MLNTRCSTEEMDDNPGLDGSDSAARIAAWLASVAVCCSLPVI